jgi:O-antigen ligase
MILISILCIKSSLFKNVPLNFWVLGLLSIHFIFAPFAFIPESAVDQGVEYFKLVILFFLMIAVVEDEISLKLLLKVYLFSTMLYSMHSLLEYFNGRHQYRMGISRMVGSDNSDPNSFGATLILSLPIAYVLLKNENIKFHKILIYVYFLIVIKCVILTGSRSSFLGMLLLLIMGIFFQYPKRKIFSLFMILLTISAVWNVMPVEKQNRVRTLWDENAGPENAKSSADGRMEGLKVSWKMFKENIWTGVGAGGDNFIGYRIAHNLDDEGHESAIQSHNLYGQVLSSFGIFGFLLFIGFISSVYKCCDFARKRFHKISFEHSLARALIVTLFMLLFLGMGGHNFYRPLWLWIAAWSSSLYILAKKDTHNKSK